MIRVTQTPQCSLLSCCACGLFTLCSKLPVSVTSTGDAFTGEKGATSHCDLGRLVQNAASWKTYLLVTWIHRQWTSHMPIDVAGAELPTRITTVVHGHVHPPLMGCLGCCWHDAKSLPAAKQYCNVCDCYCVGYDFRSFRCHRNKSNSYFLQWHQIIFLI